MPSAILENKELDRLSSGAKLELYPAVCLAIQQTSSLTEEEVKEDVCLGTDLHWQNNFWSKEDFDGCEPSTVVAVATENGIPPYHSDSWEGVYDRLAAEMNAKGYSLGWEVANAGLLYFYLGNDPE